MPSSRQGDPWRPQQSAVLNRGPGWLTVVSQGSLGKVSAEEPFPITNRDLGPLKALTESLFPISKMS